MLLSILVDLSVETDLNGVRWSSDVVCPKDNGKLCRFEILMNLLIKLIIDNQYNLFSLFYDKMIQDFNSFETRKQYKTDQVVD